MYFLLVILDIILVKIDVWVQTGLGTWTRRGWSEWVSTCEAKEETVYRLLDKIPNRSNIFSWRKVSHLSWDLVSSFIKEIGHSRRRIMKETEYRKWVLRGRWNWPFLCPLIGSTIFYIFLPYHQHFWQIGWLPAYNGNQQVVLGIFGYKCWLFTSLVINTSRIFNIYKEL